MEPEQRVRFGLYLKGLRARRNLSLRQVAALMSVKVGASYLSQLENGVKGPPSEDVLRALAEVYDQTPVQMFHTAGVDYTDEAQVFSDTDIDRAYQYVLTDPRFRFGTKVQEDLTSSTKLYIIELYEKARGVKLLTRPEKEG